LFEGKRKGGGGKLHYQKATLDAGRRAGMPSSPCDLKRLSVSGKKGKKAQ